jgi:hypothetical protein
MKVLLQPHFEASVRMKFTLPKVGTWSPLGLPKTQSLIVGVKTPCIEVFFIPLERTWTLDIQNGFAWAIWTSSAHVMGKRKARSQTGFRVRNRLDPGVCRWIATRNWKALKESYKFALDLIPIGGLSKKLLNAQSPGSPNRNNFETPLWESREKVPFGCKCDRVTQRILYGGRWWLPLSSGCGESSESVLPMATSESQHQKWFWMWTNQLVD